MDLTNLLPDECLAYIFRFISTKDRNNASLVSHRWFRIDSQTRTRLSLKAPHYLPLSIFTRFNALTDLFLVGQTYCQTINDYHIILISSTCPLLTRLSLRWCLQLTDSGIYLFSKNLTRLKEFSCADCWFTDSGLVHLLNNSSQIERLSIAHIFSHVGPLPYLHPPKSLYFIHFDGVDNPRLVQHLIIGCKNLTTLKVDRGDIDGIEIIPIDISWDKCFEMIPDDTRLATFHLNMCYNVTDAGISSFSKWRYLTELRILSRHFTDVGLISVAENCKGLKVLSVCQEHEGTTWDGIGDQGLIAVGKHSLNLEKLVLSDVNATRVSLEVIATNCQKLVTISLKSRRITDLEISCIAEKCVALKFLDINGCDVSDKGIEAFGVGCPNLVHLVVFFCSKVTREAVDLLRAKRGSSVVSCYDSSRNSD